MSIKVVRREAVFIPIKQIRPQLVNSICEKLSFKFYTEKSCNECDNKIQRHNDICGQCAAYTGGFDLGKKVVVGANKYLRIPIGSSPEMLQYLNDRGVETEIVKKVVTTKIKPIKFLATLKPEQAEALEILITAQPGVLKAPARSGKTVVSSALACRLGVKTLIIASQRDWLMGFQETFIGSDTQKPMTDLDPKRIKLCKTYDDFEQHDICLATVQTFYSEAGQKLLAKLKTTFGLIICDEVHTSAADKYVQIMAKLGAEKVLGLSGTPDRKDSKYVLVENVIGPVVHEIKVKYMRPEIRLVKTKFVKAYKGNVPWAKMVSALENDAKRLQLIADWALKDVANGHMVLIPFSQVKPINTLISLINKKAGKIVAYPFTGNLKKQVRDETIQKARNYEIKILVGTMKILSTGINIPRASCLYEVSMSSNLPAAEQRMARVLTIYEGKPNAMIRMFLDESNVRKNCMRNEWFGVLRPRFKPIVSDADNAALMDYFKSKKTEQELYDL
jgi:superfamily II DNA or RNA helicase